MSVTPALLGRESQSQVTHWLVSLAATVRFWFIERPGQGNRAESNRGRPPTYSSGFHRCITRAHTLAHACA